MAGVARRLLSSAFGSVAAFVFATSAVAYGQVAPAATGPLGLSVFGGATGVLTGLEATDNTSLVGGKNLSLTIGADLDLPPIWKLTPQLEARATYPFHQGHIVGEKTVVGGIRQPFQIPGFGRFHLQPYADVLFGYGRLAYPDGGRPNLTVPPTLLYYYTDGFTYEPGIGVKYRINTHWAVQGDVQLEHFSEPLVSSGRIWSKPFTAAVVYRFDRYHDTNPWQPVR
jgi:hypothetical protein